MGKKTFLLYHGYGTGNLSGVFNSEINDNVIKSGFLNSKPSWITQKTLPSSTEQTIVIGTVGPFKIDGKTIINNGQLSPILVSSIPDTLLVGIYDVTYADLKNVKADPIPEAKFVGFALLDNSTKDPTAYKLKDKFYLIPEISFSNVKFINPYTTTPYYVHPGLEIEISEKSVTPFENLCDIMLAETIKSYLL